ncbi:hypothetical protein PFLUV_G00208250 [Perca fluviatilis]|uniref:DDE Tnp4 domain-containing protein n=1 Tax=Perca fluviatilis TaxID=8168 RepID=A0A6A5EB03_PERFL|nr:hypothetical protein PFLUV_G00208250 [Perca fluviatilis]
MGRLNASSSSVWRHSSVRRRLQEGALRGHGYLLGDRGYPLLDFLITPVPNPVTHQERNFNHAHARTRATVERCVGLLKGRWLCLAHAGGTLLYSPKKELFSSDGTLFGGFKGPHPSGPLAVAHGRLVDGPRLTPLAPAQALGGAQG